MINASPWFGRKARIVHFYLSQEPPHADFLAGHLMRYWNRHRQVDWETLERLLARDTLWLRPPANLQCLLASHEYPAAVRHLASKAWQAVRHPQLWWDYWKHGVLRRRRVR